MNGSAIRTTAALALVLLVSATGSMGAGTPQEWKKRILDPTTIGVEPFPGSKINRKLTVDYLSKADPPKRIAIYMAAPDQIEAASAYFEKALKTKPRITGRGSEFEMQRFDLVGHGDHPPEAEGLTITISRSQWVDNKLQITMEYTPRPEAAR